MRLSSFAASFSTCCLPFRKDPALRTACQPKPPTGAGTVPRSSPLHNRRSRSPAQRTSTGRTEPILPPVPTRNPACHLTFFRWSQRRCGCSPSPRRGRLLLKATMLTLTPTRLLASAASQQAFAELCLEPGRRVHQANPVPKSEATPASQNVHPVVATEAFLGQSTVSAAGKVYSIPIHPPR